MCFLSLSGIVYFLNDDPRPLGNVPPVVDFASLQSRRCKRLNSQGPFLEFFGGR